ncbi:MAG: hypothetical protein AB7Q16_22570 [Vicinamibacterales bacterium]
MREIRPLRSLLLGGALLLAPLLCHPAQASYSLLGWHGETIGPGPYSSLALDAAGRPHVVYYDHLAFDMKYAVRGPLGWLVRPVHNASFHCGPRPALALDTAGGAHITHTCGQYLFYTREGGPVGWETELVAADVVVAGGLALDAEGRAHTTYVLSDDSGGWLMHAVRGPSGWVSDPVYPCPPGDFDGCTRAAVAVDPSGTPVIAFALDDGLEVWLTVARRDAGGWTTDRAAYLDDWAAEGLALGVDAAGLAHVAFTGSESRAVTYVRQDASGWLVDRVADADAWGFDFEVSPAGVPHVVFYDGALVTYGYRDAGAWRLQVIERGRRGYFPSLALAGGYPAFTAWDVDQGVLRFAAQTGIDVLPGEWPNVIDLRVTPKVGVVIMTAAGFDASSIVPALIRVGPGAVAPAGGKSLLKDLDLDGDLDLVFAFNPAGAHLACGPGTLVIQGVDSSARAFTLWDWVEVVGCGP